MTTPFVLASASPRRLALLTQIGRAPSLVAPVNIDETPLPDEQPLDLAIRLARAKAAAGSQKHPEALVLGADTVVACGRRILPKAETEAEARACLQLLSGRRHRVHGGIALQAPAEKGWMIMYGGRVLPGAPGKLWQRDVTTMVKFKRLMDAEIDSYIASGEWQGKAGGYAIQGRAAAFISGINGSYTNVVGLCVHTVDKLLTAALGREHA